MEVKKSERANLEKKRLLFVEVGLILSLAIVYGAFSFSTKEKAASVLDAGPQETIEEEIIPITQETPPPPPETPKIPVLSEQIDIVDDDIKVEDVVINTEDEADLGVEIMDYVEGAEELLKHLSEKYRLYMVTNGTFSVQKGRIKSAGMRPYFKDIFISEEIGYDKPGKAYFDYCFSRISNFHRENTVIIGDSLTSDIQGGKNAGIRTIWYNPHQSQNTSEIQPDYEVNELSAIEDLLEKI